MARNPFYSFRSRRGRHTWLAASVLAGMGLASAGAMAQALVSVPNGTDVPVAPGNGDTWELQATANAPALVTLPGTLNITGLVAGSTITFSNPGQLHGSGATLNIAGATTLTGGAGGLNMIYDTTGPLTVGVTGTLTLDGNTITTGTNFQGSAIYSVGDINLGTNAGAPNVTVTNNHVTTVAAGDLLNQVYGGAVYSLSGNIAIGYPTSTIVLSGNTTTNVGGAVYTNEITGGTITVQGSAITIDGNTAGIHTGAIYTGNSGSVPPAYVATSPIYIGNANGSTGTVMVEQNTAAGSGGAIQAAGDKVTINGQNITLDQNTVTGWAGDSAPGSGSGSGGAVLGAYGVTIGNPNSVVTITNNAAVGRGGAIYTSNPLLGDVLVEGSTIDMEGNNTGNISAASYGSYIGYVGGGVIYANKDITLNGDITVTGNETQYGNGGAFEAVGNLTATGSMTASGNTAPSTYAVSASEGHGGAIWTGGNVALNATTGDIVFDTNSAASDGGAIRAGLDVTLKATGGDITFEGNTGGTSGGNAIWLQGSSGGVAQPTTATFSASADHPITFYDSIANNANFGPLTVNATGPGVVIFDGSKPASATDQWSKIYGATEVQGGTFVVRNSAVYGALGSEAVPAPQAPGTSSFTVPAGGTLVGGGTAAAGGRTGTVRADSFTLVGTLDISGSYEPAGSVAQSPAGSGATPADYSTFNVATSGATSFAGGTIKFNTYLNDAGVQASDHLVIDLSGTGTLHGVGKVSVPNTNGPGELTLAGSDGILLIEVKNGTSAPGDFVLSNDVIKGGFEYELVQGTSAGNENNWYLKSKVFAGPGPSTARIPTLSEMALALLALLLAGVAVVWMRRNPARR